MKFTNCKFSKIWHSWFYRVNFISSLTSQTQKTWGRVNEERIFMFRWTDLWVSPVHMISRCFCLWFTERQRITSLTEKPIKSCNSVCYQTNEFQKNNLCCYINIRFYNFIVYSLSMWQWSFKQTRIHLKTTQSIFLFSADVLLLTDIHNYITFTQRNIQYIEDIVYSLHVWP